MAVVLLVLSELGGPGLNNSALPAAPLPLYSDLVYNRRFQVAARVGGGGGGGGLLPQHPAD